jgi:Bacterial regulatory helix-turn-helix protein, lysR family
LNFSLLPKRWSFSSMPNNDSVYVMEMHQIDYFLALCEERNFTRAAQRCGVAQPSLTRAIKKLEAELGRTLFDRDRSNPRLSGLGILVRPELLQINRSVEAVKRKATEFNAACSAPTRTMKAFMRTHHVLAVIAVLSAAVGAKQYFFPPIKAAAAVPNAGISIFQLHVDNPNKASQEIQKINDMTFVFSQPD